MTRVWDPPDRVRSWRRRPLWLVVPATALFVTLVVTDSGTRAELRDYAHGSRTVTADVVRDGSTGAPSARWFEPTLESEVQVTIPPGAYESGTVSMTSRPQDPFDSRPSGAALPGDLSSMLVYLLWFLPPWCWWASRWWTVRRSSRLIRSPRPSFKMVGLYARGRGRSRPLLYLYAADSLEGDPPLCAVPVADVQMLRRRAPFDVEVKGTPRPGGRLVAHVDGLVVWPAGRSVLVSRLRRPADGELAPPWRLGWWGVAATVVVGAGLLVSYGLWEVGETRAAAAAQDHGAHVVGTVTRTIDEWTFHVTYPLPGAPGVLAAAEVWTTNSVLADPGDQLDLVLIPGRPMEPLLQGDPYDWWTASAVFGVMWLVAIGVAVGVRGAVEAQLERVAFGPDPSAVDRLRRAATEQPRQSRWHGLTSGSFRWVFSARLGIVDGSPVGPRPLVRNRPRMRFTAEGMQLCFRDRSVTCPWGGEWSLWVSRFRNSEYLHVVGPDAPYHGRLPGTWAWRRSSAIIALVEYLTLEPSARAGLDEPARAWALVDAMNSTSWMRGVPPRPWFAHSDQLDSYVEQALGRMGVAVLQGYLVAGHPPVDAGELAAVVSARHAGPVLTSEQIRRRVDWWLDGPELPFDVLTVRAERGAGSDGSR